ncbi:MAG TPA: SDR family oxidoreductase [Rhodothermales bacterium]|nr:SDR family oxidoreductase [Rhodothermales bacterium]
MLTLDGKNILVTGGGGYGVGAGVCQAVAEAGGRLIINELDLDVAQSAADKYPGAIAIEGDVSKSEQVNRMFTTLVRQCGVLHGLVNNAGVGLNKPAHEATEEEFDRIYAIDVRGLWLVSKAFIKQLVGAKQVGHIVNIASVHAHSTNPGYAIYASAKSAVAGLTKGMALDLGKYKIRVNAVAPGYVHSEQGMGIIAQWADDAEAWIDNYRRNCQALPYLIDAVDCGYAVAFLLSDLSRSITGQTIYVDAGATSMVFGNDVIG